MFELEVDHVRLTSVELAPEIRDLFLRPRSFSHLSDIAWEEHCTECAWPTCYKSCDLYTPRNDGNCRRTVDGFSPLLDMPVFGGYVVRVKFNRWAALTARSKTIARNVVNVSRDEASFNKMSLIAARLPDIGRIIDKPGILSRMLRRIKRNSLASAHREGIAQQPNCFVMEVYNPSTAINVSLDIASRERRPGYIPFKRLLRIEPGFQRIQIPFDDIQIHLLGASDVDLTLTPNVLNPEDEGITLYFGVMTFAHDTKMPQPRAARSTKKVKVVIWDLDNTVWNGTLIEEGPSKVTLNPGIRDLIIALDSRGIVNSIASKNYEKDVFAELERFNMRQYFAYPRVGWGPKSEAVRDIIKLFNVSEDTIAFIDDQPFEREEVLAGNPKVRVYNEKECLTLLGREEFDMPVTEEGRNRRAFYQTDAVRSQVLRDTDGGYLEFLKQSNLEISIVPATLSNIDRIHELVQRTNQMNFSGTRYTKPVLADILSKTDYNSYLIDAEDRFGKYGSIGFAVILRDTPPRVVDLAFSCRVQSKRVEHAVLISLMSKHSVIGALAMEVFYRATDKNAQVGQVFGDLGFVITSQVGQDFVYSFDFSKGMPENEFVKVNFKRGEEGYLDAAGYPA